jgi:hypothetical protein
MLFTQTSTASNIPLTLHTRLRFYVTLTRRSWQGPGTSIQDNGKHWTESTFNILILQVFPTHLSVHTLSADGETSDQECVF